MTKNIGGIDRITAQAILDEGKHFDPLHHQLMGENATHSIESRC